MSSDDSFSGVKAVEERHRIDEAALAHWLQANVAGYAGPLTVHQFKGGQSNPTYRLDTPGRRYVMRRKPFGKLLPSAHAVDREFKVISALHRAGFPAPEPMGLCSDESVIGVMFYVMAMVDGRVFWTASLPELTPRKRREIYEAEIATLARLHRYDPASIGLGDYGKPGNYFGRQVERWSKQYRASATDPNFELVARGFIHVRAAQHIEALDAGRQRHRATHDRAGTLGGFNNFKCRLIDQFVVEGFQADADFLALHDGLTLKNEALPKGFGFRQHRVDKERTRTCFTQ